MKTPSFVAIRQRQQDVKNAASRVGAPKRSVIIFFFSLISKGDINPALFSLFHPFLQLRGCFSSLFAQG